MTEGSTVIISTCGDALSECYIAVLKDAGVDSLFANPDSKISIYSIDGLLIKKIVK